MSARRYLKLNTRRKIPYYLNTSEIQGELSRVNMISSHVKITCYFTRENVFTSLKIAIAIAT